MTIKVKPLVWVRVQESRELGPEPYDHAEGFGGSYIVEHRAAGHFDMWKPNLSCGDRFALEAAAKAAAQAHHEAAVRSQIEEVDPAAIRAEALREACKAAIEAYDKANPFRTADCHSDGCDCFRCCMDVMRALIDKEQDK